MSVREPNPLVRKRREMGYLSQETLASVLGVRRDAVGRWERGETRPDGLNWVRLRERLFLDDQQLEVLFNQVQAHQARQGKGHPTRPAPPLEPSTVAAEAREVAEFAQSVATSCVSAELLDRLHAEVNELARDYVSRPLTILAGDIRENTRTIRSLVHVTRYPDQARDLLLEASRITGLYAHVCLDLGHFLAARSHAHAAAMCADIAGHGGMRAWTRGLQSLIAYWEGRWDQAAHFAREGGQYRCPGSVAVRLASLEARACAAQGNRDGALGALVNAREIHDARDGDAIGVFAFPHAKRLVYESTTLLTLNDQPSLDRAVDAAKQALSIYSSAEPTDRSAGDILAARLDLAKAHLASNDLDALADQLEIVFGEPSERRTASIIRRSTEIGQMLDHRQYFGSSRARQLRRDITEFCGHPATAT